MLRRASGPFEDRGVSIEVGRYLLKVTGCRLEDHRKLQSAPDLRRTMPAALPGCGRQAVPPRDPGKCRMCRSGGRERVPASDESPAGRQPALCLSRDKIAGSSAGVLPARCPCREGSRPAGVPAQRGCRPIKRHMPGRRWSAMDPASSTPPGTGTAGRVSEVANAKLRRHTTGTFQTVPAPARFARCRSHAVIECR